MRLLPLLTVAAWALTLVIPVLDSGKNSGPRIVVSSTGGTPFDLTDAEPVFLLAWAGVLGCAATVWLLRSLKVWSVVAIVVAVLLAVLLITTIMDPPTVFWDGIDAQGQHIGGAEVGGPATGSVLWAIGIGALFMAGLGGLRHVDGVPDARRQR